MRVLLAIGVLALALVGAGCGGDGSQDAERVERPTATQEALPPTPLPAVAHPPPTARQAIGLWTRIGRSGLVRFTANGEFRIATNEVELTSAPYLTGTYEIARNTIRLRAPGAECVWRAGLDRAQDPLDDTLEVVVLKNGCSLTRGTTFVLARLALR